MDTSDLKTYILYWHSVVKSYNKNNIVIMVKSRVLKFVYILLFGLLMFSCNQVQKNNLHLVDPMIGTDGTGHTFPGATTPFGMVQLSPSNDYKGWKWCSGYHYSDSILKGFAHTHISGAGLSGLGDILFMPTAGDIKLNPGTDKDPDSGYRSRFSHKNESSYPGYYQVFLDDYQINVELTTTERVGFHRYTFNSDGGNIIIDPTHNLAERIKETEIEILSDNEIEGYKYCEGEAGTRKVYFYAQFSKPFKSSGIAINDSLIEQQTKIVHANTKAYASFDIKAGESIEVKVALSFVSFEGAKANFKAEAAERNFNQALAYAENLWKEKLDKFNVESINKEDDRTFATAVYHSFISPNLISDVNGDYIIEGATYNSTKPEYSTFSTWDTYRALHPLFTIVEHEATANFVNSLVKRHSEQKVGLPVWELLGYDNRCMIGYNTVSPLVDAVLKGVEGIDANEVFEAVYAASNALDKHSPNYDVNGMEQYLAFSFVPAEVNCSVSKTVEQNYYDWCIAKLAKKIDKKQLAIEYKNRSVGYRDLFNSNESYLWPKYQNGKWREMDNLTWTDYIRNYISGNIWGYTTYVPHDMETLIELVGGDEKFVQWLDKIFTDTSQIGGETHCDISGFVGKYGHGDEPSHHMPYLYSYTSQPWKTQKYVRQVMDDFYNDTPNGLINNEDLGQMSAWYIFSALGFYPVNPCSSTYIIGSPKVKNATLELENGHEFTVKTKNNAEKNIYIQGLTLNGKDLGRNYITHNEIMQGGELIFSMGNSPNKSFGINPEGFPKSKVIIPDTLKKAEISYSPYDANDQFLFEGSYELELRCLTENSKIYYTLDGFLPDEKSKLYTKPIHITRSTEINAISINSKGSKSPIFKRNYFSAIDISSTNKKVKIHFAHLPKQYGKEDGLMLFDRVVGTNNYGDGTWTGWNDSNCEFVIDFGEERTINFLNVGYLRACRSWIFPPKSITASISESGKEFKIIDRKELGLVDKPEDETMLVRQILKFNKTKTRYLKVSIESSGKMPEWHAAAGYNSWLFIDEIMIN